MLNRTEMITLIEEMAASTTKLIDARKDAQAHTKTLAAQRETICLSYKDDFIMLVNDLGLGLKKIIMVNSDRQKAARQAWRRSFAYIKTDKDGNITNVTGALNKAFSKPGFIIEYKGDHPAWIADTRKEE